MLFSYALLRPPIESLFLEHHGSQTLPYVWGAVAVVMVGVVGVYSRWAARADLLRLLGGSLVACGLALGALTWAHELGVRGAVFGLYVWKDVYVVLLLEIIWSLANVVSPIGRARRTYGLYCVFGSLGGLLGNLCTGQLAEATGSMSALWGGIPFLLVLGGALLIPRSIPSFRQLAAPAKEFGSSWQTFRRSEYLPWILLLIVLVQTVITLVDYQFNVVVERAYADPDARTHMIGIVYATIDGAALALQLITGPLIRAIGLPLVFVGIPIVITSVVGALAVAPSALSAAVAKVTSKTLDYSLFRTTKEMLYVPLSYAEKTSGKAWVDMATYRASKGFACLVLLAFGSTDSLAPGSLLGIGSLLGTGSRLGAGSLTIAAALALSLLWIAVARGLAGRYRKLVTRAAEIDAEDTSEPPLLGGRLAPADAQ